MDVLCNMKAYCLSFAWFKRYPTETEDHKWIHMLKFPYASGHSSLKPIWWAKGCGIPCMCVYVQWSQSVQPFFPGARKKVQVEIHRFSSEHIPIYAPEKQVTTSIFCCEKSNCLADNTAAKHKQGNISNSSQGMWCQGRQKPSAEYKASWNSDLLWTHLSLSPCAVRAFQDILHWFTANWAFSAFCSWGLISLQWRQWASWLKVNKYLY